MIKWLFLFGLLISLIALFALRYRRQIQTGLHFWRMFRQFKRAAKQPEKEFENRGADKNEPLVRCARCGKWISQTNALNLRSKTIYCSANCMEKAARIESLVDKN